jgi:V8-like Glu-specific endopeptidase
MMDRLKQWGGAALVVFGAFGTGGCATDTGEPIDLQAREQGIENGQLKPSLMNGGTVRIWAYGANGEAEGCSGQVISRDTLLTAAHCFYDVGIYDSGWSDAKSVSVMVQHQEANGNWEYPSAIGETVTVYVKSLYVSLRDANSNRQWGQDVAVVRRSTPWTSIVSTDVTALSTDSNDRPSYLYVYGHGYFADIFCDRGCNPYSDGQLRRGYFTGLSYTFSGGFYSDYYATILSDYGPNDAHTCAGDSGGPWKTVAVGDNQISGVQFGVHVMGNGVGECTEDSARSASVGYNASWIKSKVELGAGSCTNKTHTVYTGNGYSHVTADTIVCW